MTYLFLAFSIAVLASCGSDQATKTNSSGQDNHPAKTAKPSKNPPTQSPDEPGDGSLNLLEQQKKNFPRIMRELQNNNKKVSHWIWWVFPTERIGASEPPPKSNVPVDKVDFVLSNANMAMWSQILETIAQLLESNRMPNPKKPNSAIIPQVDHGRIRFSLDYWLGEVTAKTKQNDRFYQALKRLDKFSW